MQASAQALAAYLARRDVASLSRPAFIARGLESVDVLVLLGSALPGTAAAAALAWRLGLCRRVLVCGGIGHSTAGLWQAVRADRRYASVAVTDRAEADILYDLLTQIYRIPPGALRVENRSANCGDNAVHALALLREEKIPHRQLLLIQDPLMQRRSHASFARHLLPRESRLLSCAPFIPRVDALLSPHAPGAGPLWDRDRFPVAAAGRDPPPAGRRNRLRTPRPGFHHPCGHSRRRHHA